MPYDSGLFERLEELKPEHPGLMPKKMFGGIGYMLYGNMCFGIYKEFLIIRIGLDRYQAIQNQPYVGAMDITGKPMKGWAKVSPEGIEDDDELTRYMNLAIDFCETLPPK